MLRLLLHELAIIALFVLSSVGLKIPSSQLPLGRWARYGAQENYRNRPELSQSWGQYSPWFEAPSDIPPAIPPQCTVTFAQILSRHGSRDPTAHMSEAYKQIIDKIHENASSYSADVAFIRDYRYTLGAEHLTVFGQHELMTSGRMFFERYRLLSANATVFVRASGQERVVMSARNWTQGFHQAKFGTSKPYSDASYPILVLSEDSCSHNPLSPDLCDAFKHGPLTKVGPQATGRYIATFLPAIRERLNQQLPGAKLSLPDTLGIMDLCPYNTVATPTGTISKFCDLFTLEEWKKYDYLQSLGKYYGHGAGNPLGPTQGVGFANELIARLTKQPVEDHTSTNHTLDDNPLTFPCGLPLYADFSHDNDMTGVFFALGLYNDTKPLSTTTRQSVDETDGYSAAYTVPFAARVYVEKLRCSDHPEGEMVRVLMNDRVLPLHTCGGDNFGRCSLSRFLDSLSFAKQGGHWDQC